MLRLSRKTKNILFSILRFKLINFFLILVCKTVYPFVSSRAKYLISKFPVNGKIKIELQGSKGFFMVSDGSDGIASEIFWLGFKSYEPDTTDVFIQLLKNSKVFIDIGANTGLYSLISACYDVHNEVHAFEPVERAYIWLVKNKDVNKFSNFFTNNVAVSNYDGDITFNLQKVHSPRIPLGSSIREDMGESDRLIMKVPAIKLDTYVNERKLKCVDLIKVDTEGTEPAVFEGAVSVLENNRPLIICEVLPNLTEHLLMDFFSGRGYRYYKIVSGGLSECDIIVGDSEKIGNYLFVPKDKINQSLLNIKVI